MIALPVERERGERERREGCVRCDITKIHN